MAGNEKKFSKRVSGWIANGDWRSQRHQAYD